MSKDISDFISEVTSTNVITHSNCIFTNVFSIIQMTFNGLFNELPYVIITSEE